MTRPNIAFALRRLRLYVLDLSKRYLKALRKLARYLRSFLSLGLMFRRGGGKLIGHSDSNYAIDKANRVSILRSIFFLCRLLVS